jgi:hypothetical protein
VTPTRTPCASRFPHNDGGTNHRLDHATSQDRTISLEALPHDDQTEPRRARRSARKVYTLDCEEQVNQHGPTNPAYVQVMLAAISAKSWMIVDRREAIHARQTWFSAMSSTGTGTTSGRV